MTSGNPEAKFRRDAINTMANYADTVNMRLDRTETTVGKIADNVAELTVNINAQSGNVQRLERAVAGLAGDMRQLTSNIDLMVQEGRSQREVMNNLIKLCTALVERKAS